MKITKEVIHYNMAWCGTAVIPKGTPVEEATNLPGKGKYWADSWDDMTVEEDSWGRMYGFLLRESDLKENFDDDNFKCACGNTTHSQGFFPCDENGINVEPEPGWPGHYKCDRCEAIFYYNHREDTFHLAEVVT